MSALMVTMFCNCCDEGCDCGCVEDCRLTRHREAAAPAPRPVQRDTTGGGDRG